MRKLIIGTRRSELALRQTHIIIDSIKKLAPDVEFEIKKIVTKGDMVLDVTLSKVGGKGLFVKEIEQALVNQEIDLAVHSAKDMPAEMQTGLMIGAIPKRDSELDCLVIKDKQCFSWQELPAGAVVGTSSLRRQAQLLALRPDLKVEPIRGNIGTRLDKLRHGLFDAIILAEAGMQRMNWQEKISCKFTVEEMLPAVGQGSIALQCRNDDVDLLKLLNQLNHEGTCRAFAAERSFLREFGGGCHMPIAALAKCIGTEISLSGQVARSDGTKILRHTILNEKSEIIGKQVAKRLIEDGALELLAEIRGGF